MFILEILDGDRAQPGSFWEVPKKCRRRCPFKPKKPEVTPGIAPVASKKPEVSPTAALASFLLSYHHHLSMSTTHRLTLSSPPPSKRAKKASPSPPAPPPPPVSSPTPGPGDGVEPSVFDVLNIFRSCWFLNRDHLIANVLSAQKAEDG